MTLRRLGIGTMTTGAVLLESMSLLAGVPGSAAAQGASPDPSQALQDFLSRGGVRRSETQPLSPVLPAPRSAEAHHFALVGVVIAGERQLAVLEDAAGARLLAVGGWFAGYQIIEVQADHVILEADGGRQVTVRLGASVLAASERPSRTEGRDPTRAAADPGRARDREHQAASAVKAALDTFARGRGASSPGSAEAHPALGK